jgi:hypothetical protein
VARLRREQVDEATRDALALEPGERILAVARDPDGRAVVATNQALWLQRLPPAYSRLPWHEIEHASFADDVLTVARSAASADGAGRLRIPLPDVGRLPGVVRERVTASVVFDQHVRLRGREGVRVVARRRPEGDSLAWSYVVDDGLSLTVAEEASAAEAVAALRAEYG